MHRTTLPLLLVAATALSGCGAASGSSAPDDGRPQVLASFYPLAYVAERVAGPDAAVASLTPPGAEPHDLELSPRQGREIGTADLVVTLEGFQPSVDEAVAAREPAHLVDASRHMGELPAGHEGESAQEHAEHAGEPADAHEGESADEHAEHDQAGDPHLWLDPAKLVLVARDVAAELAEADPDHAEAYRQRAQELGADLGALDTAYAEGLRTCQRRTIVTAHEAFGHLAAAYDLEQVGISGIDPDAEPSPARLREVREVVRREKVTTIFTERLVSPKVAETLARDLGVRTAVLDPVEGVESGQDYLGVMRANLASLRGALGCS